MTSLQPVQKSAYLGMRCRTCGSSFIACSFSSWQLSTQISTQSPQWIETMQTLLCDLATHSAQVTLCFSMPCPWALVSVRVACLCGWIHIRNYPIVSAYLLAVSFVCPPSLPRKGLPVSDQHALAAHSSPPPCLSLQRLLPEDKRSTLQWWYPLAKIGCGASAAVTAQALSYPLDTVRRRMQLNGALGTVHPYRSTLDCVRTMLVVEGPTAFYRGCLVNCLKTMPGAAIQFVAYDIIKSTMQVLDPTTGVTSPL